MSFLLCSNKKLVLATRHDDSETIGRTENIKYFPNYLNKMNSTAKVIETNQLQIEEVDISSTIAKILEDDLNKMGKKKLETVFSVKSSVDGILGN